MKRILLVMTAATVLLLVPAGISAQDEVNAVAGEANSSFSQTQTFSPNAVTISTSEGAPYGFCEFWTQDASQCTRQTNFGYGPTKVMQIYICLSGEVSTSECSQQPEVTGPLSSAMLSDMDQRLAAYSDTGMRLVVRFTYNFGPIGPGAMDAPIDVISTHIDQVAPILRRHRDLILALEAGFIGTWGEWHDSTNGNDTAAAQKVVLDKELFYFEGLFPILVRCPGQLIQYTGTLTPHRGLGLHDDYYDSNSSDAATWSTCATRSGFCLSGYTSDQLKEYAVQVSATTMFAGEFGALDPAMQACDALNQYSYTYRPQSFSIHTFPVDIGTFLEGEGCALSFYNKIGTRIVLREVKISGDAAPGGWLCVAATMVNDGYGRVIRPRPVTLVVLQDGKLVEKTDIPTRKLDLRKLVSSATEVPSTFYFEFRLPRDLHSGPVSLALIFHDPAPSLFHQPAYALPLNSLDDVGNPVFDPVYGINRIATFNVE